MTHRPSYVNPAKRSKIAAREIHMKYFTFDINVSSWILTNVLQRVNGACVGVTIHNTQRQSPHHGDSCAAVHYPVLQQSFAREWFNKSVEVEPFSVHSVGDGTVLIGIKHSDVRVIIQIRKNLSNIHFDSV